jgi:uncharacterized membrane protein (Fun14 family)
VAVIVGLFFAGLAYLQYHQITNINWNKLQTVSEVDITTISNAIQSWSMSLIIIITMIFSFLVLPAPCIL